MLWKLSITDDDSDKKIIPIFVNESFILRPVAGKRIMDVFLDPASRLTIHSVPNISAAEYEKLEQMSMQFSYDTFVEMREKHQQRIQESYNKYMYALRLRTEAADQIGIDNIRKSRLARLQREKETIEETYRSGQKVCTDFRLLMLVRLEA